MNVGGFEVRPLKRDPDHADRLEEKIRKVPNFLPKEQSLWSVVSQAGSSFYEVGDAGLVGIVGTQRGYYAEAHITFWDRKLEGKEEVCSELSKFLLEANRLHFLLTFIPTKRRRLLKFAEAVGFKPLERTKAVTVLALFRRRL